MKRKSQSGAKLIRPGDPGHGVIACEHFAALIPKRGLKKIEETIGITPPSEGFRRSLIKGLWVFYRNSPRRADVMFSRAALKKELQRAADLADKLETSAACIWRSRDPAIFDPLERFGAMFQEWQPSHPSGVAWIGLLHEFECTTRLLADTLADDRGGPRAATAFDDLATWLKVYHRQLTTDRNPATPPADFFQFMASVVDVLRTIEHRLPAAKFRLPPNDRALRERLRRLAARMPTST
jgi:hypothetical protein